MTVRLVLIAHAATEATRAARFPADEDADPFEATDLPRRVDRVYTGPERRCVQTAAGFDLDAVTDPALRDLDTGAWRGRGLADVPESPAWLADPHFAPPGGEPLTALLERAAHWMDALPQARIVAVTHPAVIRAIALHALQAPPAAFWRLDCAPLSRTHLSRNGGRWRVRLGS